jgi:microcystin-dependent protein
VPSGYLLLDGSTASRTTYASLFALWGTTYGTGDGSTTFTLPDMRSRMPIGAGTFAALGTRDGVAEASRSLQHTHNAGTLADSSAGAHTHSIPVQGTSASNASGTGGVFSPQQVNYENHNHGGATGSNGAHTHTVSGATATSGATALPYFSVNFIVKT